MADAPKTTPLAQSPSAPVPAPAPAKPGPMPAPSPPSPGPTGAPTIAPADPIGSPRTDDTVKGTGTTKPDGVMTHPEPTGTPPTAKEVDPLVAECAAFRDEVDEFFGGDDQHGGLLKRYADLRTRVNDQLSRANHAAASGILDAAAGTFREALSRT